MGLRLHERTAMVSRARLDLERRVLDWRQAPVSNQLTKNEEMQIVNEVLSKTLGNHFRYEIRYERHGTYEKKGDEA